MVGRRADVARNAARADVHGWGHRRGANAHVDASPTVPRRTLGDMADSAPPEGFVDVVRAFDSHERGILFQWAADAPFSISDAVRADLSELLQVDVPQSPYLAMDYTLDWLHAAVTCFANPTAWRAKQKILPGTISGSQEDVDLLIAWEDPHPRLALIEAKGFTGWSNKQMASKASRLGTIFTEDVREHIDVHYVLAGPKPSAGLTTQDWPAWMRSEGRVHTLEIANPGLRWSVKRSDADGLTEGGKKNWTRWRPAPRSWA